MVREAKDTKMRFANALFELCEAKDINKITVSDVLRATGAAKQTFYNHFKDINDLIFFRFDGALRRGLRAILHRAGLPRHIQLREKAPGVLQAATAP